MVRNLPTAKNLSTIKPHPLPAVGVAYCWSVCVFLWDGNVSLFKHCGEGTQTTWSYGSLLCPPTVMTNIVTTTAKVVWLSWQVSTNGSIPYIEVSAHHCFNTNSLVRGSSSPDYIIACFPCNVGVVRHIPRNGHGLDLSNQEDFVWQKCLTIWYLPTNLSIYLFIYLSIYLSIYLPYEL